MLRATSLPPPDREEDLDTMPRYGAPVSTANRSNLLNSIHYNPSVEERPITDAKWKCANPGKTQMYFQEHEGAPGWPFVAKYDNLEALHPELQQYYFNPEDTWLRHAGGPIIARVRDQVFGLAIAGIAQRQRRAQIAWLEENAWIRAREEAADDEYGNVGVEEGDRLDESRFAVKFMTKQGQEGMPMTTLLSTRRAIESMMKSPKEKMFMDYPHEGMRVRIKVRFLSLHVLRRTVMNTLLHRGTRTPNTTSCARS